MKNTYVVHFGAGALGRGLVVPMLYESNAQVVVADTDPRLIALLKDRKSYKLHVSDDEKNPIRIIPIKDIVSPIQQEQELMAYLKQSQIITTSVRKENLKYITGVIAKAWGEEDCHGKMIICCENVEGVGTYFKELLLNSVDGNTRNHLKDIQVPDTIVDRICAVNEDVEVITSEMFHECSVDMQIVKDTGLKMIPAVDQITSHFYRKRYLLNTYADAIAFIGKKKGLTYLYEAAQDDEIQTLMNPYLSLLVKLLSLKYQIDEKESTQWFQTYKKRLSNEGIPRNLDTVARNLWDKLSVNERFIAPLLDLMQYEVNIEEGLPVLYQIIFSQESTKKEVLEQLTNIWQESKEGKLLLAQCKKTWDL